MIPYGEYAPEDAPEIQRYMEPTPRGDRLLDSRGTAAEFAIAAQQRLLEKLKENEKFITRTYARARDGERYLIHDAKMEPELRSYLLNKRLAWPDTDAAAVGHRAWLGLHPLLGTAIMSCIGLAIAEQYGFDIVTDQTATHETVISSSQEQIFERLLGSAVPSSPSQETTANELGQLVIGMTGLNLQAIQPADIIQLQAEKQDFRNFRRLLAERAAEIGNIRILRIVASDSTLLPRRSFKLGTTTSVLYRSVLPMCFSTRAMSRCRMSLQLHLRMPPLHFLPVRRRDLRLDCWHIAACGYMTITRQESPHRWLSRILSAQNTAALLACPLGLETHFGLPDQSSGAKTPSKHRVRKLFGLR